MAKKKKTDKDIFNSLAEDFGGEIVANASPVPYYIDTGNLAMNFVCSGRFITGGVPGGRIIEFYGPPSSAKSLWGMSVLHGVQKIGGYPILLDCENALNPEFAERAGHIDLNRFIRYTPETIERCFRKMIAVIKKIREVDQDAPICIVYDSITVSPCERELRETDLPDEYTDAEYKKIVGAKEQPGERARQAGNGLRKLTPILEKYNATLFVINQTRMKIGVLYGSPETTGGGGNALPFYASLRIRTSAQKHIESKSLKKALGVNIKIANKKNRSNTPFIEIPTASAEGGIPLYFDRGIDPLGGLLIALIQSGRVKPLKAGFYEVNKPWCGDKEIKFRAALSKNVVPLDTLMECPALIDAETPEQVQDYLADFGEAIALSGSDETIEVDVEDENLDLSKG